MPKKSIYHDQECRNGPVGTIDDYVVDDRCGFCGEFESECLCDEFEPDCLCGESESECLCGKFEPECIYD